MDSKRSSTISLPGSRPLQFAKDFLVFLTFESLHSGSQHNYTEVQASSSGSLVEQTTPKQQTRASPNIVNSHASFTSMSASSSTWTPGGIRIWPFISSYATTKDTDATAETQRLGAVRRLARSFLQGSHVSSSDSKDSSALLPITHYPSLLEIKARAFGLLHTNPCEEARAASLMDSGKFSLSFGTKWST